ncbi:DUF1120 domain-containing protein [Pantoea sp. BAV 3049]|uniref:DUF1120 domain-containing protein n=1 Tax=Pantoea sp. BAV 3049 TaxID=2654188 RepID=UPI00131E265E|nr:DUF1120 domain-containing protein [Pantoea sp. BAV 3049]
MRISLLASALTLAVATMSFTASAADTATMAVTGTITPTTCDVALSASSVDLGNIPATELLTKANDYTQDYQSLSVSCDAASQIALRTTDDRAASAYTNADFQTVSALTLPGVDQNIFGLGTDSADGKIGSLQLVITAANIDGTAATVLASTDKSSWTSQGNSYLLAKNGYVALTTNAGGTTPDSFTEATLTLSPRIYLKQGSAYPAGEEVKINGSVTFSVVYL